MSETLTKEETVEFRNIYKLLFPKESDGVEVTEEVKTSPLYRRYQQLAPRFYSMMLAARRKKGLRTW